MGFKLIWSILLFNLNGFDDLFKCKIIKCIIEIIIVINDTIKWIENNRFNKILLINLFPQIINNIFFPINGITAIKLVITIMAQ